jgi:hypothetical protein
MGLRIWSDGRRLSINRRGMALNLLPPAREDECTDC